MSLDVWYLQRSRYVFYFDDYPLSLGVIRVWKITKIISKLICAVNNIVVHKYVYFLAPSKRECFINLQCNSIVLTLAKGMEKPVTKFVKLIYNFKDVIIFYCIVQHKLIFLILYFLLNILYFLLNILSIICWRRLQQISR